MWQKRIKQHGITASKHLLQFNLIQYTDSTVYETKSYLASPTFDVDMLQKATSNRYHDKCTKTLTFRAVHVSPLKYL